LTKWRTASKTWKPCLSTLFTGNSIKVRVWAHSGKKHDGWTTENEPTGQSVLWLFLSSVVEKHFNYYLGDSLVGSFQVMPARTHWVRVVQRLAL
jgi:hypothetical protein